MRHHRLCISFAVLLLVWSSLLPCPSTIAQGKSGDVILRGQVACLDENGHRLSPERDCNKAPSGYELQTSDRRKFRIDGKDSLAAMFTESRVRSSELQIKGILHENGRVELTKVQALRGGELFDIYYYCEVCDITAYGPGDCFCCYNPFEFKAVPALGPKK
jgi:hypothetical protein